MPTLADLRSGDGYRGLDRFDAHEAELLWGVGWGEDHFSSAIVRLHGVPCFAEILPEHVELDGPASAWRSYLVVRLTPAQFALEQEWRPVPDQAIPDLNADPATRRRQVRDHFERRERYGVRERRYGDDAVLGWLDGLPGTGLRRIIPRDSGAGAGMPVEVPRPRPFPNGSRTRWIYDDVLADPDDPQYYEIIDGALIPHLGHSFPHQVILGELSRALDRAVNDPGLGLAFFRPYDVVLPSGDVLQPDLVAFLQPLREAGKRGTVPDLVLEVVDASTRSRDLGRKWQLYVEIGVREYWVVDIEERTVGALALHGTRFGDLDQEADLVRSAIVPAFAISPAELFAELDGFDWH